MCKVAADFWEESTLLIGFLWPACTLIICTFNNWFKDLTILCHGKMLLIAGDKSEIV